ncbi:MAG UNVERIFIED_CONTAM: hypothetical protein LVT10_07555 [Anaerolineae bacterium]
MCWRHWAAIILLGGTEPPAPSTPQLELLSIQPSANVTGATHPTSPSPQLVQMAVSLVPNFQLGGNACARLSFPYPRHPLRWATDRRHQRGR